SYWYRNLRHTVRFEDTVKLLTGKGFGTFVESSAHPVLVMGVQETADVTAVGSLRRDEGGLERFLTSAAELFVHGTHVDWAAVFEGTGARQVDLPTYPFQHQHYWLEPTTRSAAVEPTGIDSWRYRITWQGLGGDAPGALSGRWLLVVPQGVEPGTADEAEAALAGAGAQVERLVIDPAATGREELTALLTTHTHLAADADSAADAAHTASAADAAHDGLTGILSLLGVDERPHPAHFGLPLAMAGTTVLAQAVVDSGTRARLWALTRGAVAVSPGERPSAAGAQVWGLGRGVALEHPTVWGGLVDLPADPDARAWQRVVAALAGQRGRDGEDQVAVRASGTYGRRLVPAGSAPVRRAYTPRGTVLVTGGTGALGAQVARWAARGGAAHLVLAGRRGPDAPGAADLAAELRALGAEVTLAACDVADRDALAALLTEHPPTAVFHTAGVPHSETFLDTGLGSLAEVYGGKVAGALHLDELTRSLDLEAFVLYASGAGVWGSGGQSAYGAANAALDALAERRRAEGLAATSVAWGLWGGGGMGEGAGEEFLGSRGLRTMDPASAVEALGAALDRDDVCVALADLDWPLFAKAYCALRPSALISRLPGVREALARTDAGTDREQAGNALAARLADVDPAERYEIVLAEVCGGVAAVLGHGGPQDVDPEEAFSTLGFSSLTASEFAARLGRATGRRLPPTLVFDHPTASALAGHLAALLAPAPDEDPARGTDPEEAGIRAVLATLPLPVLREAGLLDTLLALATPERFSGTARFTEPGGGADIDALDDEALVELALRDAA
ncbi:type I polyketide synthase, partial [Streptomyces sp. NPDC002701]|uniref:beta-ketoacyl reductase n=1 Tax=Streptomyces sp. NPDC002701 TaxID=3364661 RepID=UPI0036A25B78